MSFDKDTMKDFLKKNKDSRTAIGEAMKELAVESAKHAPPEMLIKATATAICQALQATCKDPGDAAQILAICVGFLASFTRDDHQGVPRTPEEMAAARRRVIDIIAEWAAEYADQVANEKDEPDEEEQEQDNPFKGFRV